MTDANQLLTQVRDFLYTEEPDEAARWSLYKQLKNNMEHQSLWLPMFKEHPRWSQEPLIWSHLKGMDGYIQNWTSGPSSASVPDYEEAFPGFPIKLFLRGGSYSGRISTEPLPKAQAQCCVHICIDHPECAYDYGQEGNGTYDVAITDILDATLVALKGKLKALHTFTLDVAESGSWGDAHVQTSLWPSVSMYYNTKPQDRGFGRLKTLLQSRHQLRRLTLSNKASLSEIHSRTGRARPYCSWLTKTSWWSKLEHLDLHQNRLHSQDLAWLFPAPMPALTTLVLRGNQLNDDAAQALTREGAFPALEHLDLRDNPISQEQADALRGHPALPALKTLLV